MFIGKCIEYFIYLFSLGSYKLKTLDEQAVGSKQLYNRCKDVIHLDDFQLEKEKKSVNNLINHHENITSGFAIYTDNYRLRCLVEMGLWKSLLVISKLMEEIDKTWPYVLYHITIASDNDDKQKLEYIMNKHENIIYDLCDDIEVCIERLLTEYNYKIFEERLEKYKAEVENMDHHDIVLAQKRICFFPDHYKQNLLTSPFKTKINELKRVMEKLQSTSNHRFETIIYIKIVFYECAYMWLQMKKTFENNTALEDEAYILMKSALEMFTNLEDFCDLLQEYNMFFMD